MSEQTLQALLAERVTAFANSDKPVEIIDEHVKKMFTNVVDNCFGRYGDRSFLFRQLNWYGSRHTPTYPSPQYLTLPSSTRLRIVQATAI